MATEDTPPMIRRSGENLQRGECVTPQRDLGFSSGVIVDTEKDEVGADVVTVLFLAGHELRQKRILAGQAQLQRVRASAEELLDLLLHLYDSAANHTCDRPIVPGSVGDTWPRYWNGDLLVRSQWEWDVAEALQRASVLFFPNCHANIHVITRNAEPDFLVCNHGRWGILELDGRHHDDPEQRAIDHYKDTRFGQYGVRVFRYKYRDWKSRTDDLVSDFLDKLSIMDST